LLWPLFSVRVSFGITGAGITFTDAKGSDASFGITGVGITLNDAKGSDAKMNNKALFG
jgi:type 1 fimbria pilin